MNRLDAQFAFLIEADKLKSVDRSNVLMDLSRPENSAEHSWHAMLWAVVLAEHAGPDVDITRVIQMLLLHDIVEIDAGDHPIHEEFDPQDVAQKEAKAAERLFGLLPNDQGAQLHALWQEFEAAQTVDAKFAKAIDHMHPEFQVTMAPVWQPDHAEIAAENLARGRVSRLRHEWPEMFDLCETLLAKRSPAPSRLWSQLTFLAEADKLKSVLRATPITDGSRRENSAEHCWHVALYAVVLAEHADQPFELGPLLRMLILHDLVEIDAGDTPFWDNPDQTSQIEAENAAAERLFGLLPEDQALALRAVWQEFEAGQSAEAHFGKSLDRVCAPVQNLASGGGSWRDYAVTSDRYQAKLDPRIRNGASALADWIMPRAMAMIDSLN